jgi:hypothetical protein
MPVLRDLRVTKVPVALRVQLGSRDLRVCP